MSYQYMTEANLSALASPRYGLRGTKAVTGVETFSCCSEKYGKSVNASSDANLIRRIIRLHKVACLRTD